jgi:nucleotide-binding universal stress UspA family protein
MSPDARPAVIAYDGSEEAGAAIETAVALFAGRPFVIVSVWEPGLAQAMAPLRDPTGLNVMPASLAETAAVDQIQHDHAVTTAEAGARIARELGASAEPYSVPDHVDVAETLAAIADERDACAIVVGSRGLGRVKSHLFGSTSRELLRRTGRPVLVVRAPE